MRSALEDGAMLEQMRKHSRSFIIYIFFGIIIAVFVINFGPQSQGCVAELCLARSLKQAMLRLKSGRLGGRACSTSTAIAGIHGTSWLTWLRPQQAPAAACNSSESHRPVSRSIRERH